MNIIELFKIVSKPPSLTKEELAKEVQKAQLKKKICELRFRLENETWNKKSSQEMFSHFKSILIDMANLTLNYYGREMISDLSQLHNSFKDFPDKKIPAFFLGDSVYRNAVSKKQISENDNGQIVGMGSFLDEILSKIETALLLKAKKDFRTSTDVHRHRLKLQVLFTAVVFLIAFFIIIGFYRLLEEVQLSASATAYLEYIKAAESGVKKWHNDVGTIHPLTEEGDIYTGLLKSSFQQQLIRKGSDAGKWSQWQGPYLPERFPLLLKDDSMEIVNISVALFDINGDGTNDIPLGSRTVYISAHGIDRRLWRKIDAILDKDIGKNETEQRIKGRVIYVPWNNKWMAIYLWDHAD